MKPTDATRWITDPRFTPYLAQAGGDHKTAVQLYVWNSRISAAMFETLHHVEVLVRNAIDAQFTPLDPSAAPRTTWLEDASILHPPLLRAYARPSGGSPASTTSPPAAASSRACHSDSGARSSTRGTNPSESPTCTGPSPTAPAPAARSPH
ncbi:MAG: hypothetical protein Q8O56_09610 [Solirubrobacteraceae bacterium]|nr:hypothetical protein [Solirubrobacteraceae bacterium]